MSLPIPIQVVYAGLVGLFFALVIATAQQKWKLKVFFLLALRLAIGWQFFFEGMHKIHSHYVGVTETSKPFSSEPYFKEAPGPLAPYMRAINGDPAKIIAERMTPKQELTAAAFAKMGIPEQATQCPDAVARDLDSIIEKASATIRENADEQLKQLPELHEKALKTIAGTEKKETDAAKDEAGKAAAKKKADDARSKSEKDRDETKTKLEARSNKGREFAEVAASEAKAEYARWVYGVDRREIKMARISGDVAFTGPQRLRFVALLKKEKENAEERTRLGLGTGYGIEVKKAQAARADYWAAEADLAKEIESFETELKTKINDGKAPEKVIEPTPLQRNDHLTRWFLAAVGACLLFGLFTRISCVLAAGFLLLTYLTHPPFPWFTLPPGTEGNPLFINKNAVEFIALLALACMPTGKWLGLDAMICYLFRRKPKATTQT